MSCKFRFTIIDSSQVTGNPNLVVAHCQDCACPTSLPSLPQFFHHGLDSTRAVEYICSPELRVEPLTDGYWSAFDPVAGSGVVVLNGLAREFLSSFNTPLSLTTALDMHDEFRDDIKRAHARLVTLQLLRPCDERIRLTTNNSKVLTAWLHLTNQCNLRCGYCYLQKSSEDMDERTAVGAVDAVLRSAIAEGYTTVKLKYGGGEPSLVMDRIFSTHDYAVEQCHVHGFQLLAVLLSNGTGLTEAGIEGLKARGIKLMVSLDGPHQSQKAQRPFRNGQDSTQQVIINIDRFIERGLPPHLSSTITGWNCEAVDEVIRFALARDLTFSLNFYRENDHSISSPDLRYSEERMVEGLKAAFDAIEEHLPPWSVVGTILDRGQLVSPREHPCGAARDYMVIDHRGHISKCQMEIDKWVTDIHHHNPLEVIRDSPVGVQNLSSLEKEGCRDCTWRYWCSGGCPLTTHRAFGRYDTPSPNCGIYKAIYPEALRLEGLRLLKYSRQQRDD